MQTAQPSPFDPHPPLRTLGVLVRAASGEPSLLVAGAGAHLCVLHCLQNLRTSAGCWLPLLPESSEDNGPSARAVLITVLGRC